MINWFLKYEIYAKSNLFKRRLEKAIKIIKDAYEINKSWYVAFSGGKDSTVILDLVRNQVADTVAIWGNDEW